MVQIYRPTKRQTALKAQTLTINSLDLHGQGVARYQQQVCFVPGALPGESVKVALTRKGNILQGQLLALHQASAQRISPACPHYAQCGGCQLQHLSQADQLHYKQVALAQLLERQGLSPVQWAEPLKGPAWGYRRTLRLATFKGRVGFRARASQSIVSVDSCPVADPLLSALLPSLQQLVSSLADSKALGHIELLSLPPQRAALWRLTGPLKPADRQKLLAWASEQQLLLFCQLGDTVEQLLPSVPVALGYTLDGLQLSVGAADFIQVNGSVNDAMVAQAMAWLAPQTGERILDAYSGLGNFSLPLAKRGAQVLAAEGVAAMTARCQANARANGLQLTARTIDLDDAKAVAQLLADPLDAVLLDPARPGARVLCQALAEAGPRRVLYVSCNPATWKRDAVLLQQGGYRLQQLGLMDMFTQTAHVELMALFIREK
ncbi:23S rRNA (uracil(1939)-C(5))-methyltransferase RlmD [Gallaecimonas sp. GXIMD1310]|uniref:23S rRNA (uracil(1939)-C(5))-methyltransferase RlmD n=1 Tax=Gallaecimonas sp. GXIMD1310 TaxID=3131926 RepID=UPI0032482A86